MSFLGTTALALPQNGNVVGGTSTVSRPDAATMHIDQRTNTSIIDWQSYSIRAGETVRYFQPGRSSISLNRVRGVDPSEIYGQLSANGQVWVINPNGLLIGSGAKVEVGGFLGSTLHIDNADFQNATYRFRASGQEALASIVNRGGIRTADGGYVVLISPVITNQGAIVSSTGKTYLAAGGEVTVHFAGNDLVGFTVDEHAAAEALGIANAGSINADGGEVVLSAKVAGDLLKTVINNTGIVEARTIECRDGVIKLLGGVENNRIEVAGVLDASAPTGGDGGSIETSAAAVNVAHRARVTTLAPQGRTGTWLIDPSDYMIAADGGDITGAQLSTILASNNLTIQTTAAGSGNGDISVNDHVSWSTDSMLSLKAHRDVDINATIAANGASAGLVLSPDFDNSGIGAFSLSGASIDLPGATATLSIAGSAYTVLNDVNALQAMENNLAGNYALGSDIDASATSGWDSGAGFAPIGDGNDFTGAFDGLGHTVSDLAIDRPADSSVGLFGATGNTAIIRNVGLLNVDIASRRGLGALVGSHDGTITNSYSTGRVAGDGQAVGGLVGDNSGAISVSYSSANVSSTDDELAGGLVGDSDTSGTITDCYSTGRVSGPEGVGGLAGGNGGAITNCYSTGTVTGQSEVGGLVGNHSRGLISGCYTTGSIAGRVGPLATVTGSTGGLSDEQMGQQGTFVGWDFADTWSLADAPTPHHRWGIETVPPAASAPEPADAPNDATERAFREWLGIGDVLENRLPQPLFTSDMQKAKDLLNKLPSTPILSREELEYHYASLRVRVQRLTPEQAADVALSADPAGLRQIGEVKEWLGKNIDYLNAELTDAGGLYKMHLQNQLAQVTKADDNLGTMFQAGQLRDAVQQAYFDHKSLTAEQLKALRQADPALRRRVASFIRAQSEEFEAEDMRADYRRLAQNLEDGNLHQTAQRLADMEARRKAERERRLAAMFEEVDRDVDRAQRLERALKRQQQLLYVETELPLLQSYAEKHSEGSRFVGESGTKLKEIASEMRAIYWRMESGTHSLRDEARFDTLGFRAAALAAVAYESGADLAAQRAAQLKNWQAIAETTQNVAGNTLVALSALASGGSSAAAATFIRASTAGLTTFIDSTFVKKDDAYSTAFNTIITTTVSAIPGGSKFKEKVAMNFTKSLIYGYKNTLTAVYNGRVSPEQAKAHFVRNIALTFGKATMGTFVAPGVRAGFDSAAAQVAIRTAAGQFYDTVFRGGGGHGHLDVGSD